VWVVVLPTLGLDGVDDRENFLEPVVPGLIPRRQVTVFHKAGDFLEPVSGDSRAVSKLLIFRSIVTDLWETVYAPIIHKAEVGIHLTHARLPGRC
jgi:hypothetical protein